MEINFLQELGLSEKASLAYLAMLKLGESTANNIAKETHLNRTTIYDIQTELLKKGFASYVIKQGKKYFSASSPDKILDLLKEKEIKLKENLNSLKQLQKNKPEETLVSVYAGKEGLKTLVEDILRTGKNFILIGWKGKIWKYLEYSYPHLYKKRIERKISYKALVNFDNKASIKKEKLVNFKVFPEKFSFPSTTIVYGEKVMITISLDDPVTIILIESKKLSETYKNYFELMWKNLK